jgi:hypothetical protein
MLGKPGYYFCPVVSIDVIAEVDKDIGIYFVYDAVWHPI